MEMWAFIISIGAFLVSLFTFLHKVYTNRFNTSVKVLGMYRQPYQGFFMKILVKNHSSNPISITSIYVDGILSFNKEEIRLTNSFTIIPVNSNILPVSIGSYGATELTLFFYTLKDIRDYNHPVPIKINTSRKEINEVIKTETLIKNLSDITK